MSAPYIYCTYPRIQNILGVTGAKFKLDDVPPDEFGDAVNAACDDVDLYCWQRYSQAQLQSSDLIAVWAATRAAYYLSTRRGNPAPAPLTVRFVDTTKKLEGVQAHKLSVPRLAQLKSFAPTMSNMLATLRPMPRSAVERSRSTGHPEHYQQTQDVWDRFGGNINLDFQI